GRAIRNLVTLALAAVLVMDDDFAGTGDYHQFLFAVGHVAHRAVEADRAVGLRIHAGSDRGARSGATDVERAHRQLRAGLADRLRGDHADSLADVDEMTAAQVAPVARGAKAVTRVAGERRAHLDLVDAEHLDPLDLVLAEQLARLVQRLLRFRIDD